MLLKYRYIYNLHFLMNQTFDPTAMPPYPTKPPMPPMPTASPMPPMPCLMPPCIDRLDGILDIDVVNGPIFIQDGGDMIDTLKRK